MWHCDALFGFISLETECFSEYEDGMMGTFPFYLKTCNIISEIRPSSSSSPLYVFGKIPKNLTKMLSERDESLLKSSVGVNVPLAVHTRTHTRTHTHTHTHTHTTCRQQTAGNLWHTCTHTVLQWWSYRSGLGGGRLLGSKHALPLLVHGRVLLRVLPRCHTNTTGTQKQQQQQDVRPSHVTFNQQHDKCLLKCFVEIWLLHVLDRCGDFHSWLKLQTAKKCF